MVERPTAPKKTSPARAHLGKRGHLDVTLAAAQPDRAVVLVEHRREVVAQTGAGQRRRDDRGEGHDRAAADLLLQPAADGGVGDRRDDGHVGVEMADEEHHAQRPRVVARDHCDGVGARLDGLAQLLVGRVLEAPHVGAGRLQRLVRLVRQVSLAQQ